MAGSVHDAKVFSNSNVNRKLNGGKLPKTFHLLLLGFEAVPNYLIGDPAYPLTPFYMKEFQSCSTNDQVIFNNMLRSARNQIECAFGRLKARWKFLSRNVDLKLQHVPTVVYSCFVLHNFCEHKQHGLEEQDIQAQILRNKNEEENTPNVPDPVYSPNTDEGEYVRSILTEYIRHNLPDGY